MVIPAGQPGDAYLIDVAHRLREDFGIQHATVQVETDPNRLVPSPLTTLFDKQGLESTCRGAFTNSHDDAGWCDPSGSKYRKPALPTAVSRLADARPAGFADPLRRVRSWFFQG
jgi:hypothetical protein